MTKRKRKRKSKKGYYERSGLYGAIDQLGSVNFYGSGGTGKKTKKKTKRKRRRKSQ